MKTLANRYAASANPFDRFHPSLAGGLNLTQDERACARRHDESLARIRSDHLTGLCGVAYRHDPGGE